MMNCDEISYCVLFGSGMGTLAIMEDDGCTAKTL